MTRDEHRAKCIEALNYMLRLHGAHSLISPFLAIELLDSLHGIVWVIPIETTEGMLQDSHIRGWRAMAAAGDLTNPPEEK